VPKSNKTIRWPVPSRSNCARIYSPRASLNQNSLTIPSSKDSTRRPSMLSKLTLCSTLNHSVSLHCPPRLRLNLSSSELSQVWTSHRRNRMFRKIKLLQMSTASRKIKEQRKDRSGMSSSECHSGGNFTMASTSETERLSGTLSRIQLVWSVSPRSHSTTTCSSSASDECTDLIS